MNSRPRFLWALALVVTLASAAYQRLTGPTHPTRGSFRVGTEKIRFTLPRSFDGPGDAEIQIPVSSPGVTGSIEHKRYLSNDSWQKTRLERRGGYLVGSLPHQPPAGKVVYRISLAAGGGNEIPITSEPLVVRFRGAVPAYILYPHIVLMSVGMLLSTRAGLEGMSRGNGTLPLAFWTIVFLAIGGMVLGPLVQKQAFGAYWTGWPVGSDLTDNKTVVAFLLWVAAWLRLRKNREASTWAIVASIFLLVVYAIPHSVLGSRIDYTHVPESSPAHALPQRRDVSGVMPAVPGINRQAFFEPYDSQLRVTEGPEIIRTRQSPQHDLPAFVQTLEQAERDLDRAGFRLRKFRPLLFGVGLYRRVLFGEGEFESDVGVHVTVREVMNNLADSPALGPVRRVELLIR